MTAKPERQSASGQQANQPPAQDPPPPSELPADPPVQRLAYSLKEAAAATGLSRDLLYDEMRAGRLAYLKIGRRRIITRQQLDAFLTRPRPART